ncbi:dde superfamily endonuclease [Holotrichia oblita]|uniref:Dde superfamily endonuclease n=1 Tax=Holotrichia oblita TaxID=644536 RepID=A0ACB9TEG8_HOLOL|nr:dde superfamily endonuclease [Holotrichia oblita]
MADNFPTAIGALDCTHVRIKRPSIHTDEYICRKGFTSFNVQATCTRYSMELFTSVDASWSGSVHDSKIWKNSDIYGILKKKPNVVLLGDEGYVISEWLMTPFRNPRTDEERSFNIDVIRKNE